MKIKNKSGITLIALVVMIIVLLILAGVTIATLTGQNGLLNRTKLAGEKTKYEAAKETVTLKISDGTAKFLAEENRMPTVTELAQFMSNQEEIDILVTKYYESASTVNGIAIPTELTGFLVKDPNQIKYSFLIGQSCEIEKVSDDNGTTLVAVNEFEQNNFRSSIEATDNQGGSENTGAVEDIPSVTESRYLLVEVYDHISGDSAILNEITIYDSNYDKVNYSVVSSDVYGSDIGAEPLYWRNVNNFGYDNLNDGNISYNSNSEGGQNATVFSWGPIVEYGTSINSGYFTRFVIDLGSDIAIGRVDICVGNVQARIPKLISIYSVDNYSSSTYENNVKQRNNTGLTLLGTKEFTEAITTPTWYLCAGTEMPVKTILVEVYDHIAGDCAVVNELNILDNNDNLIKYEVINKEYYDTADSTTPVYWNNINCWGYDNLYDGNIKYANNGEGAINATVFNCGPYGTSANTGNFARFLIQVNAKKTINDIQICIGGAENRTAKSLSAYYVDDYSSSTYENNVKQRNNTGLTVIKTIDFSEVVTTPTWYSFIK